jgi:hypothetical protein
MLFPSTRHRGSEPSRPYTPHDLIYQAESNATPLHLSPDVDQLVPKVSVRPLVTAQTRTVESNGIHGQTAWRAWPPGNLLTLGASPGFHGGAE